MVIYTGLNLEGWGFIEVCVFREFFATAVRFSRRLCVPRGGCTFLAAGVRFSAAGTRFSRRVYVFRRGCAFRRPVHVVRAGCTLLTLGVRFSREVCFFRGGSRGGHR